MMKFAKLKRALACVLAAAMLMTMLTACTGDIAGADASGTVTFENSKTAKLYSKLDKGYTANYILKRETGSGGTSEITEVYIYAPEYGIYNQFGSNEAEVITYKSDAAQAYWLNLDKKTYHDNSRCGDFVNGLLIAADFNGTKWETGTTFGYYSESYHYPGDELFGAIDITYCYDDNGNLKYLITNDNSMNWHETIQIKSLKFSYDANMVKIPSGYTYIV